jgi:peroxiredoxin
MSDPNPHASESKVAPWSVSQWFNTSQALTLEQFRGKLVVVGAFQMLCPGCVAHCIPQLKKLHALSKDMPLQVVGLHTVFEHHQAMQPHALEVFIHEYQLKFPVGVDRNDGDSPLPMTMRRWGLGGTPSTLVFGPTGNLLLHQMGQLDDLALGLFLGSHSTSTLG